MNEGPSEPREFSAQRTCLFCGRSFPLPILDEPSWTFVHLGSAEDGGDYHRCPDCTAEGRTKPRTAEGDELSEIGEASEAALGLLAQRLEAAGGKLLCGFVVVLAEGVKPNGGVFFTADEDDGPEDADEIVNFALQGVGQFAQAQGVPFAIMDMPTSPGGQG